MASVLYKTTWLESWGSGVKRMVDACREQGVPEPYYEIRPGGVAIIFTLATQIGESDFGGNFGSDFGGDFGSQLSDRQAVILSAIIKDGKETAKHLAVVLGVSQRSVENDLSYLHKNGFIEKSTKDTRSPWIVLKRK